MVAVSLPLTFALVAFQATTTDVGTGGPSPADAPRIEAVGVVRSRVPGRSVAILRAEGRSRVLAVGETAFGARLVAIDDAGLTLDIAGRQIALGLTLAAPPPAVARTLPPPAATPAGPPEDPQTPARDMDKKQVQLRIGEEMNRILSETAAVPVLEEGRVVGLQLTRVAEGTLLTDAGLRAGDVLSEVNGTQIDGMGTLIGLWSRLQSATELRAVVLRNGQPVSLRVTLR